MTLLALHAIANNNGGLNAAEQPLKTAGPGAGRSVPRRAPRRVRLPTAKYDAARGRRRRRNCVHRPTVAHFDQNSPKFK